MYAKIGFTSEFFSNHDVYSAVPEHAVCSLAVTVAKRFFCCFFKRPVGLFQDVHCQSQLFTVKLNIKQRQLHCVFN